MSENRPDPYADIKKDKQETPEPEVKQGMLTAVSQIIVLRPKEEIAGMTVPERRSAGPRLHMKTGESKSKKDIEKAIGKTKTKGLMITSTHHRGQLIESEGHDEWQAKKRRELTPNR